MSQQAGAAHPTLLDSDEIRRLIAAAAHWRGWQQEKHSGQRGRVGEHSARALGSGLDYAETRLYQPGDEPRHINWRASARSGHTQVRLFHRDINPQTCLLLDRRAGMCFGTRTRLKLTQALRLALLLTAHEAGQGHEVACLDLAGQAHWLPARAGTAAAQQLLARCNRSCPPGRETRPQTGLGDALDLLLGRLPRGSRVYLLSDFADLTTADLTRLRRLGASHAVWAVAVHDPAERQLPALGPVSLVWGDAHSRVEADGAQRLRQAAAFAARRDELARWFAQGGARFSDLATDCDDLIAALDGPG